MLFSASNGLVCGKEEGSGSVSGCKKLQDDYGHIGIANMPNINNSIIESALVDNKAKFKLTNYSFEFNNQTSVYPVCKKLLSLHYEKGQGGAGDKFDLAIPNCLNTNAKYIYSDDKLKIEEFNADNFTSDNWLIKDSSNSLYATDGKFSPNSKALAFLKQLFPDCFKDNNTTTTTTCLENKGFGATKTNQNEPVIKKNITETYCMVNGKKNDIQEAFIYDPSQNPLDNFNKCNEYYYELKDIPLSAENLKVSIPVKEKIFSSSSGDFNGFNKYDCSDVTYDKIKVTVNKNYDVDRLNDARKNMTDCDNCSINQKIEEKYNSISELINDIDCIITFEKPNLTICNALKKDPTNAFSGFKKNFSDQKCTDDELKNYCSTFSSNCKLNNITDPLSEIVTNTSLGELATQASYFMTRIVYLATIYNHESDNYKKTELKRNITKEANALRDCLGINPSGQNDNGDLVNLLAHSQSSPDQRNLGSIATYLEKFYNDIKPSLGSDSNSTSNLDFNSAMLTLSNSVKSYKEKVTVGEIDQSIPDKCNDKKNLLELKDKNSCVFSQLDNQEYKDFYENAANAGEAIKNESIEADESINNLNEVDALSKYLSESSKPLPSSKNKKEYAKALVNRAALFNKAIDAYANLSEQLPLPSKTKLEKCSDKKIIDKAVAEYKAVKDKEESDAVEVARNAIKVADPSNNLPTDNSQGYYPPQGQAVVVDTNASLMMDFLLKSQKIYSDSLQAGYGMFAAQSNQMMSSVMTYQANVTQQILNSYQPPPSPFTYPGVSNSIFNQPNI